MVDKKTKAITLLVLADIHGNLSALKSIWKEVKREAIDAIIIAGDLPITTPKSMVIRYIVSNWNLNRSKYSRWVYKGTGRELFIKKQLESVKKIEEFFSDSATNIFVGYTSGNVDTREVIEYLKTSKTIQLLDFNSKRKDKHKLKNVLEIYGIPGSLIHIEDGMCDGEFSFQEYNSMVTEFQANNRPLQPWLLVSHEQPFFKLDTHVVRKTNSKLYDYTFKERGGSKKLLELITTKNPVLTIAGHYHEYPGLREVKKNPILNPGCAAVYQYAMVKLTFSRRDNGWKKNDIKINFSKAQKKGLDFINFMYSQRSV